MKSGKRWVFAFLSIWIVFLGVFGGVTVLVDPYFHYHKPLSWLQYPINNEWYQNNGIVKHFDYDAIITGTSMTENFKTSEFDQMFDVNSVKVPFAGEGYKGINDNLTIAVSYNPNIQVILRGLDCAGFLKPKDTMSYAADFYPYYLYDNYLYNDVKYIFNKGVFFNATLGVWEYTRSAGITTSFDEYGNWNDRYEFGKDAVDDVYERPDRADVVTPITEEDYAVIEGTISQNVTELAAQHSDIQFYLFFTPYSIYYWDRIHQQGTLERQLAAEKYAIGLLLEYDNIHLFSFFTEYDMICDLDNYIDSIHYGQDINSQILVWMSEGTHELTRDNYLEYCEQEYEFYMNYDYDALFEPDAE